LIGSGQLGGRLEHVAPYAGGENWLPFTGLSAGYPGPTGFLF
jgi:hypothetical protein